MTEAEIAQLNQSLADMPAGGVSILGVLLLIFLVFVAALALLLPGTADQPLHAEEEGESAAVWGPSAAGLEALGHRSEAERSIHFAYEMVALTPAAVREIERRIKSLIRWNAMAMVVRANRQHDGIGGHISRGDEARSAGSNPYAEGLQRELDEEVVIETPYRAQAAGVLQPIESPLLREVIPSHLRSGDGYWFGLSVRARVFV